MTKGTNNDDKFLLGISPTYFQKIFQKQKSLIQKNKSLKRKDCIIINTIFQNDDYYFNQFETSNHFIYEILKELETGNIDFCFKWSQIKELLKFHPFDLECKLHYYDGNHGKYYFEVYLKNIS